MNLPLNCRLLLNISFRMKVEVPDIALSHTTVYKRVVAESMIKLLKRVSSVCTVTLDNGGEFAPHEKVAKAMNADIYFAKPMLVISGELTKIPMASFGEPRLKKWR
ncbi:MAG: hypothetical protein QS721_01835 [Candidatus Endonucleobacter sp. (ex Gigantidas childressi)]|nr:hypothetical protein [Candidatus Endonucleobacter sp. (ex Gigantidas childressi)]